MCAMSSCHTAPWHVVNLSSWFIKDTTSMCLNLLMGAVNLSVHNWPWMFWNLQEDSYQSVLFQYVISGSSLTKTKFTYPARFFGVNVPWDVFLYNMSSDMGEFCFAYRTWHFFPFLLRVEPCMWCVCDGAVCLPHYLVQNGFLRGHTFLK